MPKIFDDNRFRADTTRAYRISIPFRIGLLISESFNSILVGISSANLHIIYNERESLI